MEDELANYSQSERVEHAIGELTKQKLEPGVVIETKIFEDLLGIKSTARSFSFLISDIREALCHRGMWLTGQGFNGEAFAIADYQDNFWVAKLAVARAERDLALKLVLLSNTPTQSFSDLQVRRHENIKREISMKLIALQRVAQMDRLLKKKPKKQTEQTDEPPENENGSNLPSLND